MNILIMFFMVINFFTYSAYSMEKTDLADHGINPIDAEVLIKVVKEEVKSGNLNIINLAKNIINEHIEYLKNVIETLNCSCDIKIKVDFIDQYIAKFSDKAIECINSTSKDEINKASQMKITHYLDSMINNTNHLLEAEITAWTIIHNSLSDDLSHEQLLILLPEIFQMYAHDSSNYATREALVWVVNVSAARKILSLLLVKIAIEDDRSDNEEKILVFCHNNIGKPNWFWNKFLQLIDIKDSESPLWLSKEDKEYFNHKQKHFVKLTSSDIDLKQTQLHVILYSDSGHELIGSNIFTNYSLFDGDINEYKKNMLKHEEEQRQDSLKTLLAEKGKPKVYKNKYPPKKTPKNHHNNYKKTPKKNTKNNAIITNHKVVAPCNIAPATIDNKIIDENDDFIKVKQPKLSKSDIDEKTYPLIIKHIDDNKLRAKLSVDSYDKLLSLAKTRKLHQYEYYLHENIWRINQREGYQYNGNYYDLEKHFSILNKKIAEISLMKSKYDIKYAINYSSNINKELSLDERKITQQNLFTYFITFHVTNNDEKFTQTYYGDIYSSSRAKSDGWIRSMDILSKEERNNYDQSCDAFKRLYLCNFISDHCKQSAVDGFWLRNSKHTEPTFVIDLSEHKLANFIKDIYAKHPNIINTIDAVVIGVVSEYDLCVRCQSMLQGLQWNLSHILQASLKQIKRRDMTHLIKINPDLITMIIANSEKEIENTRVKVENVKEFDQDLKLDNDENHRLFLYKNN